MLCLWPVRCGGRGLVVGGCSCTLLGEGDGGSTAGKGCRGERLCTRTLKDSAVSAIARRGSTPPATMMAGRPTTLKLKQRSGACRGRPLLTQGSGACRDRPLLTYRSTRAPGVDEAPPPPRAATWCKRRLGAGAPRRCAASKDARRWKARAGTPRSLLHGGATWVCAAEAWHRLALRPQR